MKASVTKAQRLEQAAAGVAVLVGVVAMISLCGWAFHVDQLKTIVAGGQTMKANTAASLLAAAGGLLILALRPNRTCQWVATGLAIFVTLLAGLSLTESLADVDLRIDQLLFADVPTHANAIPGSHPGRMSVATAALLALVGLGLLTMQRAPRLSQCVASLAMALGGLAMLSVFYGIDSLRQVSIYSSMAVHTAVSLFALSGGTLLAAAARDSTQPLGSDYVGGILIRRVLPVVVVVPPVLGLFRLRGERMGWYGLEFGIALFAISNVLIIAVVVVWTARMLDRADIRRREMEADREDLLSRERKARERAESASRSKDTLLSVVSHELRTPLTPALMLVRSMENDPALPASMREDVAMIREQIHIEVRIINDLLDMASLTNADFSLRREVIDLKPLLLQAITMMGASAHDAGLTLKHAFDPRPLQIYADPVRLGQIVRNVLDNAVKFSPRGGIIMLDAGQGEGDQRDRITIEITDPGVGIPHGALERVFEPFEQADNSMTRRFGGLGIGLTIARNLAIAHGGTLEAFSAGPEQGTTFTLSLPSDLPATPTITPSDVPADGATAAVPAAPLSLLVVEDNAQTLKMMGRLLKSRGYEVTTVESATAALRATVDRSFDVVVSDIGLPDMNGWELLHSLKQIRPICGIAVSGFVTEEDRERSAAAGFHAHLDKPLDMDRLEQMIREASASGCHAVPV